MYILTVVDLRQTNDYFVYFVVVKSCDSETPFCGMERTERLEMVGGFGMTPSGNLMHTEWLIPKPWPDRDDCDDAQRAPWVGSFAILEAHRRRLQPTAPSPVCAFGVDIWFALLV